MLTLIGNVTGEPDERLRFRNWMLVELNELPAGMPDTLWIANPAGAVTFAEPSAGLPRFSSVSDIEWPFSAARGGAREYGREGLPVWAGHRRRPEHQGAE